MIERITVKNLVLVESLTLEFGPGLSVLTGETGAGKSVLVGALSLLCGAKGGPELVRTGAEEAVVSGSFVVESNPEALAWLATREILPEDGAVLVRRTLKKTGRGSLFIQSTPVTRADLNDFALLLVDLHSQHEHQSLFVETNHRALLDRFADLESETRDFARVFDELSQLQAEYRASLARVQDRDREMDILRHAIEEIQAAALEPDEESALLNERDALLQFERLNQHLSNLHVALEGNDDGQGGMVRAAKSARTEVAAAARIDQRLAAIAERVESITYEVEDIHRAVVEAHERLVFDPARLDEIEERLATIRRLQRKYGETIEAVIHYQHEAIGRLKDSESAEENIERLKLSIATIERRVTDGARSLHAKRAESALRLAAEIRSVLNELAMERASFCVQVDLRTNDAGRLICNASGADQVRFLIAPNPGEPERPLNSIASGGEISRVMLAIKTILAETDHVASLIFDEIDSGIGGQVALAVGRHLGTVARTKQVICITHLASIAAHADNHTVVEKSQQGERTFVTVRPVTNEAREREIARMLSGDPIAAESLEHARALLAKYRGM